MTEIDVTELRAKLAAAMEGPWEWRNDQMSTPSRPIEQWAISPGVLIADTRDGTPGGDEIDRANADLLISAVNALPALLDEIEALEKAGTQGEWHIQDGCSWRRIGTDWHDGDVLCPTNARDGHPDLTARDGRLYSNLKQIVLLHNNLPTIIEALREKGL